MNEQLTLGMKRPNTLLENWTLPSVRDFAECQISRRSANQYFAECSTRQNFALGKDSFAECQTLGKILHSAKLYFAECQALGKASRSAKFRCTVTAVAYCQILPSASLRALGKMFFLFFLNILCRVPPRPGARQRIFYRVLPVALGKIRLKK